MWSGLYTISLLKRNAWIYQRCQFPPSHDTLRYNCHKDKSALAKARLERLKLYREAFPCGSKGKSSAVRPAAINSVPEIHIGADVVIFAYNAMMGACVSGISLLFAFEIYFELAP